MERWAPLLALIPLVVFYVVESRWGPRAGVLLAIAFTLADLGYHWIRHRKLHKLGLGAGALVVGLGGMTLLSNDERWFLWSPVVGDVVFAAVLGASVWLGNPVLTMAAREADPTLELEPDEERLFAGITLRLGINFLLHAVVCAWAVGESRETWLLVSGPVQYAMIAVQVGLEVAWSRMTLPPADPPEGD
ncbi:MAG: septation protein IspZ [Proteobacteria bacterium]|nr:septation protein IspZ [Pseudomonadota bacterium]